MKSLFNPLIAAISMLALAYPVAAQDEVPAFEVLTTPENWGSFELDFETHYSKKKFGFSQWKCDEFATTKSLSVVNPFSDLRCGWEYDGTASIQGMSQIIHKVNRVSIYISAYNSSLTERCLRTIRLLYGSQPDMSDALAIEYPGYFTGSKEFQFEIENPERMRYYRVELVCDGHGKSTSSDFYAGLAYAKFYATAEEDGIPVIWETDTDGTKACNIMSEAGDLHMICYELDADGNIISDSSQTQTVTPTESDIDWADTSWTNPAGGRWEAATVSAPRTPGHRMAIRAKAELADGTFSPERQFYYSTDGITAGVYAPLSDTDVAGPAYYTLQGIRVSDSSGGIFIRVSNGRAEKVAL